MAVITVGVVAGIVTKFRSVETHTSLHWGIDFLTLVISDRSFCTHGIHILYRVSKKSEF